ncbi:MAG: 16S rRNA (cytosine(967)-C(5))-methyltransferase RsmB [Syntrophobacterales bacterium]|nr:MAG: 16S rRNA (cytosine(967)-C(5))-methyltransferase RsmB [Syntrophobacterales bacterium]
MTSSNKKPQVMKDTPRPLAVQILNRVEEGGFAQPLLDAFLSRVTLPTPQDRGLLTQLVYGTLRLRNRLDWIIREVYTGDFKSMEPGIRNILRVALYQVMFADRVPTYAATDEAVKMTKTLYPGRSNLVNAILRNAARRMDKIKYPLFDEDPLSHISVVHSHPLWLVRMWTKKLGLEETHSLCEANNEIPPLMVRTNRLKTTQPDLIARLKVSGCGAVPSRYSPDGIVLSDLPVSVGEMPLYKEGQMQIQDEASQLISLLVDPKPGETVLDVCAGVGIKTTHLAQLMRNSGRIVAMDINRKKIEPSRLLFRRLGATIIEPITYDATQDPPEDLRERFDRVLVDVPCSGLGTLRRNPEIRWNTTPEDMKKNPPLQKAILNRSVSYLKKEGVVIYSTCTISSAENEAVIEGFLVDNPGFECVRPATVPAEMLDETGRFRTFPHRHGADGFFSATLKRKGD